MVWREVGKIIRPVCRSKSTESSDGRGTLAKTNEMAAVEDGGRMQKSSSFVEEDRKREC